MRAGTVASASYRRGPIAFRVVRLGHRQRATQRQPEARRKIPAWLRFRRWSVNYWDDRMGAIMAKSMGKPFDLILGRKTYEIFAAH